MYHGGTTSLPITSPNLSFKEFLSRMNQTMQVHTAEHALQQISGNPIVATKKKRVTNAMSSSDQGSRVDFQYTLPKTCSDFVRQLNLACGSGDAEAKLIIERLAPGMAAVLKKNKQWIAPNCPLEARTSDISLVKDRSEVSVPGEEVYMKLINHLLGPIPLPDGNNASETNVTGMESQQNEGYDEALGTLITDEHTNSYLHRKSEEWTAAD